MPITSGGNTEKNVLNELGTLDRVIQEKKIFTSLANMPDEVQTTLLQNGWIGNRSSDENPNVVLSLHKNLERVKAVVKRYEPGLIWVDEHSNGVNWLELHPAVVVNRFPRDANTVLKLCSHAMARAPQFDLYYPRAYPVAKVTEASSFSMDYSLTACASLLRAFVDGRGVKCSKNGQVPLSALHFAVNKCELDDDAGDQTCMTGEGEEWRAFFEDFYKVVNDNQKFTEPAGDLELSALTAASRRALERLSQRRPQMAMDGHKNVWTIKCNQTCLSNRIDDILERCGRINSSNAADHDDYVVQKYVETPLTVKNERFEVRAWLVVSTLNDLLTVWLYRTCCVHRRPHRPSMDTPSVYDQSERSHRHAVRGPMQTCGLRQLKGKLRAAAAATTTTTAASPDDQDRGEWALLRGIRQSVVWSVLAAAEGNHLNLRPNCFELFQATFVVGDDFRPWLIDVESDPWIARGHQHHHAESSVASGVAENLAKILIHRYHASLTKIGMFDLLHQNSIPGKPYVPRPFGEKPIPKKCDMPREKVRQNVRRGHDEPVNTYVEKIQADDYCQQRIVSTCLTFTGMKDGTRSKIRNTVLENDLSLSDLEESMARLRVGPAVDAHEAKYCLHLLDEWKTKVKSVERFYKTVLTRNRT